MTVIRTTVAIAALLVAGSWAAMAQTAVIVPNIGTGGAPVANTASFIRCYSLYQGLSEKLTAEKKIDDPAAMMAEVSKWSMAASLANTNNAMNFGQAMTMGDAEKKKFDAALKTNSPIVKAQMTQCDALKPERDALLDKAGQPVAHGG